MKILYNNYVLNTSIDIIANISPILHRIIKEKKKNNINELFLEEEFEIVAVQYVFEELILYPFFSSNTIQELQSNLQLYKIQHIIEYYQMEKVMFIIRDILDSINENNYNIEELKVFFHLLKYFKLELNVFNKKLTFYIIRKIFEKKIDFNKIDEKNKTFIIQCIIEKVRPFYTYQEIPNKYIIDLQLD